MESAELDQSGQNSSCSGQSDHSLLVEGQIPQNQHRIYIYVAEKFIDFQIIEQNGADVLAGKKENLAIFEETQIGQYVQPQSVDSLK